MCLVDRFVRALDFALAEKWEEAQNALEGIGEPVARKLTMLFERLRRRDADRAIASSEVRHAMGNLLTVAQANVEGMVDGVVDLTPRRLENVRKALTEAARLVTERRASPEQDVAKHDARGQT